MLARSLDHYHLCSCHLKSIWLEIHG
jgi:hypothetical protein